MFQFFSRIGRFWRLGKRIIVPLKSVPQNESPGQLSNKLALNLAVLGECLGPSPDVIIREFKIGSQKVINGAIVFIDGLIDKEQIDRNILAPLMIDTRKTETEILSNNILEFIKTKVVPIGDVKTQQKVIEIVDCILSGDTVLLLDGAAEALVFSTKGWEQRAIAEPPSEVVVRGPREGFTETLRTNTAILRRKIRNANLTFEVMRLGKQTKTDICIVYLKNITNRGLVDEVKRRLKGIKTDSILESGYIEQFIEDAPFSPFETIDYSERPDSIAGKILEGRVAIIINGAPAVLTVPTLFVEFFQSPEDYYVRAYYCNFDSLD